MITNLAKNLRKRAFSLVLMQCLVTLIMTGVGYWFYDENTALQLFLGGSIGSISNAIFSVFAFRYVGASSSRQVYDAFFRGERIKLFVTIVLFLITFKLIDTVDVSLFVGFGTILLAQWLAPFYFLNLQKLG